MLSKPSGRKLATRLSTLSNSQHLIKMNTIPDYEDEDDLPMSPPPRKRTTFSEFDKGGFVRIRATGRDEEGSKDRSNKRKKFVRPRAED